MPLPFMRKKESGIAGVAIKRRTPDEKPMEAEQPSDNSAMEAAASDLLRAFEAKDVKHIALALQSAFQIYDSLSDDITEGQE